MTNTDIYKRLPLSDDRPCFRLLELDLDDAEPYADGTVLIATMAAYNWNDEIDYEALSYTWGPGAIIGHVKINNTVFPVSQSLLIALQQIRRDQETLAMPRKLWVDAVCINQSDNAEKSHQVMLMREIYSHASRVIAWIGGPDHLSPVAFDTQSRLGSTRCIYFSVTNQCLQNCAQDVILSDTYEFSGEPAWIAYFRTVSADRTPLSPRINNDYRTQFLGTFGDFPSHDPETVFPALPDSAWSAISQEIGIIIEDKEMFVTERGYVGLGHEGLAKGDIVCIFSGGEFPFLIRKDSTGGGKSFNFLSECYMHGIMDGEAYSSHGKQELEEFVII